MKHIFVLFVTTLMLCTLHAQPDATAPRKIVFFGDSLTAGYGLEDHTVMAFPGIIQKKIDAEKLPYQVVNAGLSGDTTAGGVRRIDWILRSPVDVFVLELGGNDGLRGLPVTVSKTNLQTILNKVREKNPKVKLVVAGMQMPRSMGEEYAQEFAQIFPELAEANDAILIPFLLEGVGGVPELNLPDGIHPTAEGHERVAATVWSALAPALK